MNSVKNKVQLIGHVGQDPEIKNLENSKLAKFTIATSESYKNSNGEKVENTQWHNVTAWGKTAEIVEKYFTKGQFVCIEGKLEHSSYETEQGEKRYRTDVVANQVLILSKKGTEQVEATSN